MARQCAPTAALPLAPPPDIAAEAAPLLPLEARDLVVERGRVRLLHGVSFRLAGQGCTVVMGPNGAGKSLLLRVLHGLIEPTAGSVSWAGSAPDAEVRRRQAFVFQKPVLLRRSVLANMSFVLRARGWSRRGAKEHAMSLLDAARLADLAGRPARVLSGGEQQRLAIARALALAPSVLFLDEPSASLDPTSTRLIEELIEGACAAGVRVILVTHDAGQARRLADDVMFMHAGRLEVHEPAGRFFSSAGSVRARAYLEGRLLA